MVIVVVPMTFSVPKRNTSKCFVRHAKICENSKNCGGGGVGTAATTLRFSANPCNPLIIFADISKYFLCFS